MAEETKPDKKVEDESAKQGTSLIEGTDWYGRHKLGTRIALMVFLLIYAITALTGNVSSGQELIDIIEASKDGVSFKDTVAALKDVAQSDKLKNEITGYFALAAFAIVALGNNGLSIIVDGVKAIKK